MHHIGNRWGFGPQAVGLALGTGHHPIGCRPRLSGLGSALSKLNGDLVARAEVHLVGRLPVESRVRHDGVVFRHVEGDKALDGGRRVELVPEDRACRRSRWPSPGPARREDSWSGLQESNPPASLSTRGGATVTVRCARAFGHVRPRRGRPRRPYKRRVVTNWVLAKGEWRLMPRLSSRTARKAVQKVFDAYLAQSDQVSASQAR